MDIFIKLFSCLAVLFAVCYVLYFCLKELNLFHRKQPKVESSNGCFHQSFISVIAVRCILLIFAVHWSYYRYGDLSIYLNSGIIQFFDDTTPVLKIIVCIFNFVISIYALYLIYESTNYKTRIYVTLCISVMPTVLYHIIPGFAGISFFLITYCTILLGKKAEKLYPYYISVIFYPPSVFFYTSLFRENRHHFYCIAFLATLSFVSYMIVTSFYEYRLSLLAYIPCILTFILNLLFTGFHFKSKEDRAYLVVSLLTPSHAVISPWFIEKLSHKDPFILKLSFIVSLFCTALLIALVSLNYYPELLLGGWT